MPRTSREKVRSIIEVDDDEVPDLDPFIETANNLVTDVCTGSGYTNAKLELIERWLSAHFYAIRDPRMTTKESRGQLGGIRQQFESKVDLGLNLTRYGQQAVILDSAGNLKQLESSSKQRKIKKMFWLGTPSADWPEV